MCTVSHPRFTSGDPGTQNTEQLAAGHPAGVAGIPSQPLSAEVHACLFAFLLGLTAYPLPSEKAEDPVYATW